MGMAAPQNFQNVQMVLLEILIPPLVSGFSEGSAQSKHRGILGLDFKTPKLFQL